MKLYNGYIITKHNCKLFYKIFTTNKANMFIFINYNTINYNFKQTNLITQFIKHNYHVILLEHIEYNDIFNKKQYITRLNQHIKTITSIYNKAKQIFNTKYGFIITNNNIIDILSLNKQIIKLYGYIIIVINQQHNMYNKYLQIIIYLCKKLLLLSNDNSHNKMIRNNPSQTKHLFNIYQNYYNIHNTYNIDVSMLIQYNHTNNIKSIINKCYINNLYNKIDIILYKNLNNTQCTIENTYNIISWMIGHYNYINMKNLG